MSVKLVIIDLLELIDILPYSSDVMPKQNVYKGNLRRFELTPHIKISF